MIAHRIADARHPIFDGTGAMLRGGGWNSIGQRVIYAAESYAGAMLEILVHANLAVPPKHHQVVRIVIPESVKIETLSPSALPGWDAEDVTRANLSTEATEEVSSRLAVTFKNRRTCSDGSDSIRTASSSKTLFP